MPTKAASASGAPVDGAHGGVEMTFSGVNPSFAHAVPAGAGTPAAKDAARAREAGPSKELAGHAGSGIVEMPSVLDISPDALWDELGPRYQRAVVLAQAYARGYIVRRYFRRVAKATQRMPAAAFWALTAFFVVAKVSILVVLILAWADTFTAFGVAPPQTGLSQWASPMQDHPHDWGSWYQSLLQSHIVSGVGLFAAVLIPIVVRKGGAVHVWVGRAFMVLWVWHMLDGLINASTVLLNRGYHEDLYPTDGFTMWLYVQFAFIANMVCDYVVHALAAVRYKAATPRSVRWLMVALSGHSVLYTVAMVAIAVYNLLVAPHDSVSEDAEEYSIIFLVDFPVWGYLCLRNMVYWAGYDPVPHMYTWVVEHQRNALFVAHMTVITGIANATYKYSRETGRAPWLTTVLFASQEVSVLFWVLYKEKRVNDVLRAATTTSAAQRRRMQRTYHLNSALLSTVRTVVGSPKGMHATASFITVGTDRSAGAATNPDAEVFYV